MKKIFSILVMVSMIFCGCSTVENTTVIGSGNTVKSEKNVTGVDVEVSNDVDVNSNNESLKENQIKKEETFSESNSLIEETRTAENQLEKVSPFVSSSPQSDGITHADLVNWNSNDRDIFNNNYTGNNTFKLSVYNTINVIGGGASDITAEIHFPLGGKFNYKWLFDFVVMQDMVGNGSYANVTILSGEDALYPTFTIRSDTTDENMYEVDLSGIRDLTIRFECHAVNQGFCGGIIVSENMVE